MLKLHNVSKTFRRGETEIPVLAGASLHVAPGELVTVEGPSGCGKSTLLLAAGGLLAPDAGTIEIDGKDPYRLGPDARAALRAKALGFVFQQFHLIPYLSVLDNVLSPLLARPSDGAEDRAAELLRRFGLADRADHRPAELSVGERQRTSLARALLNRPKLILADEPTGNLDEANSRAVLGGLARFAHDGGAVLLVTHDHNAGEFAQRRLRLEDGSIRRRPAGAADAAGAG